MPVEAALARLRAGAPEAALAALAALPDDHAPPARHAAIGMALLALGRVEEALAALRIAVALGETRPATMLNLALAEDRAGDAARGRALMQELKRLLPTWDEPCLRLAESLRRAGDASAAIAEYEHTLEVNPRRAEALLSLAALLMQRHEPARAQMLLLRCCAVTPAHAPTWDALGVALMLTGDAADAESAFDQAQRLAPADGTIALHRVEASMAAGTGEAELARLEQAAAADPLNAALLAARGTLLMHLGRRAEAVAVLEAATALAPDSPLATQALAHAMVAAARVGDAIPVLRRAVELAPDDAALRNNLAATLLRGQQHGEAREVLEGLLATHGDSLGVLCNLTNALVSLGLQDEGLATANRAVALAPGAPLAWRAMCNVLAYHPGVTGAGLLAAQRRIGDSLPRVPPPAREAARPRAADRRLRVGLLSATLKTHPVGWLTIAGFENLDPARFELVCLGQPPSEDAIQRRFRAAAAEWHVVDGEPTEALVPRLRALDLDILIDLGGYGDRGMMAACASRVAPMQVKWVGAQSHSSGLAEMDWFITDRWETPPGFEGLYTERLLRLPDGYVCYSPPAYAPDVGTLPALANGHVTFGCFNNLAKITPAVLAGWAAILARIPGARLVLKAHQFADAATRTRLLAAFPGIDPARIELRAGSPHRALLAQYNEIDIVLDPFPYSGGLTTCEALWMGVPTVTLVGEAFFERLSYSNLMNAGVPGLCAFDHADYARTAVELAADTDTRRLWRHGMRAQIRRNPLGRADWFVADFQATVQRALEAAP